MRRALLPVEEVVLSSLEYVPDRSLFLGRCREDRHLGDAVLAAHALGGWEAVQVVFDGWLASERERAEANRREAARDRDLQDAVLTSLEYVAHRYAHLRYAFLDACRRDPQLGDAALAAHTLGGWLAVEVVFSGWLDAEGSAPGE